MRYEHCVRRVHSGNANIMRHLDDMSAEGWELVTVVDERGTDTSLHYWRKAIPYEGEIETDEEGGTISIHLGVTTLGMDPRDLIDRVQREFARLGFRNRS